MCIVTRTSLLTGHTHRQSRKHKRSVVIADTLRSAGYATSISGKWHQPGHPATGARTVTFRDLPRLEPNRGYYLIADDGWIRVAGRPIPGFNDGSLADRFRTAPQDIAVPTASAPAHPLPQE